MSIDSGGRPIIGASMARVEKGTFAAPKMPKFSLETPRIESVSLTGARLLVPLKIANANSFPLPLGGIIGSVQLAGADVGQIALKEQAPVPSGKEMTVNIPLQINLISAGEAVAQAIHAGVAEMKIDATLNAGGATLPVKISQTVQLQR